MELLILFGLIGFSILTWWRFSYGVTILFALLPLYLIRFSFFGIPTTILELLILITTLIGLWHYRVEVRQLCHDLRAQRILMSGLLLLLVGATIGVAVSTDVQRALGEWKAFYIEPILLALVLSAAQYRSDMRPHIYRGLCYSTLAVVAFTIWQVLSGGTFVPAGFWQQDGSFRATAWYGFPNGVGILLGLCFFPVLTYIRSRVRHSTIAMIVFSIATIIAMFAAQSTGALLGVLAGTGILLLSHARTRTYTIGIALLGLTVFAVLPMDHSIKQEILFQDRSGQIRLHMWQDTAELLKDSPLLGAGMASYTDRIVPYHSLVNGEKIEIFHHPHNIFLTLWVNTGIIGLIGFIGILVAITRVLVQRRDWDTLAFVAALIVMGLVDSPYIKNDWAVIIWSILLVTTVATTKKHP
jgi:O-antigen ligase